MNRRAPALMWLAFALESAASAQALLPQDALTPQGREVESRISAVTLYRGRAAVTRTASLQLGPGMYELRFTNLPETIQPETLQARAPRGARPGDTAEKLRVLSVEFSAEPVAEAESPALAELDGQIERLGSQIAEIDRTRELFDSEWAFLDALVARITAESGEKVGTAALDVDAVRRQMEFIRAERDRISKAQQELAREKADLEKQLAALRQRREAMASSANVARTATVTVAALDDISSTIELSYLVSNATWEPAYNVRAAADGSTVALEYDALLTQRSGEDWTDVALTLSTAQPALATNPPELQPWYVDVWRAEQPPRDFAAADSRLEQERVARRAIAPEELARLNAELERLSSAAEVTGEGPAVTFTLPRPVSVPTNLEKQQRTRIAAIDTQADRIHVAVPLLTNTVYVRSDLANASAYQILPGRASIFIGPNYIGPTMVPAVAPQGRFELYFGIDPTVKAERALLTKHTESTGLLGGGRRTEYDYRITIDNGTGKALVMELWDRYPVSRNEQIQVELRDLNVQLAGDKKYLDEQKPQGLLKWLLSVPATARDRTPSVITYSVRIDRAKDVEMTELPE